VADSCECCNEPSISIKSRDFLTSLEELGAKEVLCSMGLVTNFMVTSKYAVYVEKARSSLRMAKIQGRNV
jgi:hypothetical protein